MWQTAPAAQAAGGRQALTKLLQTGAQSPKTNVNDPDAPFGYRDGMEEQEQGSPIQLEIFNLGDLYVILDLRMPICQLIREEVREAPEKGYRGKFNDQTGFST
jgi:hypothetical protein